MADWTNTGFKRSLKITTTKTGDNTPPSIYTINLDGTAAFGIYEALDDTAFSQLSDADFDTRVAAFQQYIHDTYDVSDPGLYESINWSQDKLPMNIINISIEQFPGPSESLVHAVSSSPLQETVVVTATDGSTGYTFIVSGSGYMDGIQLQGTSTIYNLSIVSVVPIYGTYSHYTASVTLPTV